MEVEKEEPKIDQVLYSLNIGNAARNCKQILKPVRVIKIGRKYFTVIRVEKCWSAHRHQYRLDDWQEHTIHPKNSKLYRSEQEWEDEKESETLSDKIRAVFGNWGIPNLTLSQLKDIMEIMKNESL